MSDESSQFGRWLNDQIRMRGWNASQLAERAGLSKGTISQLINGRIQGRHAQLSTLESIARALNVSLITVLEQCGIDLGVSPYHPDIQTVADPHLIGLIRAILSLGQRERHVLLQNIIMLHHQQ